MPNYKVVDADKLDADLATLADSIRVKNGSEEELSFPEGMKEAVDSIEGREGMSLKDTIKAIFDITKTAAGFFYSAKYVAGNSIHWAYEYAFDELLEYASTSKVTNMCGMFRSCWMSTTSNHVGIDPNLPSFDTSNVTNMLAMFDNCSAIDTIPWMDTSKVTNMNNFVRSCTRLSHIPSLNTESVTNMASMFSSCQYRLKTIPSLNTSKVTTMEKMFQYCFVLESVPWMDTSNVTNMNEMFYRTDALTTIPLLDTSKVAYMGSMFYGCAALTTVPALDVRSAVSTTACKNMFTSCVNLTEVWIKNIHTNIQVGSGTSYGHLLTTDSLVHLIYELCKTSNYMNLTVGTANLEKLANVYVKTIDITDEMRAEDDLVDKKLPFVVCESTDEGATQIITYAGFKKWYIK